MGLPTALLLARAGYNVNGYDIDKKKIEALNNNQILFEEDGLKDLFLQAKNNFHPSTILESSDVFIITVPTPLTVQKTCDLSFVLSAVDSVKNVLEDDDLVVLESTVPPGTTIQKLKPVLDETNKKYSLSYVSEKAIPGNTIYEMQYNHRIIGGVDSQSAEKTKDIYSRFVKSQIHLTDTTTAESVKLMENTYRDVNIALANEFAITLEKLHVNPWNAIKLANLHPRVNIHQPGPGVGGHCIPIDPWFLVDEKKSLLLRNARMINDGMPLFVTKLIEQINFRNDTKKIVLMGVSYKGNVDDDRESPAYIIKKILESKKMKVQLYDPLIQNNSKIITTLLDATKDANCLVLLTDHDVFKSINPKNITNMKSKNLIDTKNILDHQKWLNAGFKLKILGVSRFLIND